MSATFFTTIYIFFISSEYCSTFPISPKLFSTHISSSACQKAFTVREKSLAYKSRCAQTVFAQKLETQMPLHRKAFTHSKLLHRLFCPAKLLHTASFYTEKLLHREAFTHRSFYTQQAFTHSTLLHSKLLNTASFYAEQLLHREAFKDRCVYTRKLLHKEALTHRTFYELVCAKPLPSTIF